MTGTILSVFDFTGNWSRPYAEAGWDVIRIDTKLQNDGFEEFSINVADLTTDWFYENIFDSFETIDGILLAPPCTDFAVSGAKHWAAKDKTESTLFGDVNRLDEYVNLVYQCLNIVDLCEPYFWALENPVGRIASLVPELGKPWYFQPYWYGDTYSKKTGLWGNFNKPMPTNIVEPEKGKHGSRTQKYGGKSERTKELRSITPTGFAKAFFEANNSLPEYY